MRPKAMAMVEAAGLSWPERSFKESDDILDSNYREYERQSLFNALKDPESAVSRLQALILFEEDKFVTRSWRQAWDSEIENNFGNVSLSPHSLANSSFLSYLLYFISD